MSLLDINTTGRNRNVLSPVVEPTIVTAPTSPITPPFDPTTSSFTLRVTNFNLLSPVITSAGVNSVLFTGTDGGAFSVPIGKGVVVKNLYIKLTGLASTGAYVGSTWIPPTLRGYRNGTNTTVTNTFPFIISNYVITDHFGFNSTPAGGRRTLLAGESLTLGVSVAYSANASGFTFTTLRGDAYAECLLVNI